MRCHGAPEEFGKGDTEVPSLLLDGEGEPATIDFSHPRA